MFNPPPKLSYAKVRNKSKNKNQSSSQQKIIFDNQSSTDIFSHLNQENLNYIKKEIKNKKAQSTQLQSNNSQEVNNNQKNKEPIKQQNLSKEIVFQNFKEEQQKYQDKSAKGQNEQKVKKGITPLSIMTHSQRVYEKYKNQNQVIQTDPQYQQTLRQTQVDDSDMKFLIQKCSPSFSAQKTQKQQLIKINPIPSQSQQKSPLAIVSKQCARKLSKQYKSKSPRKLSISQTQRFKTYHQDRPSKTNLNLDMFGSVSNEEKVQKLSQLNLNPCFIQTNQFLSFLQCYIDDIAQNKELDEKNSIQKILQNKKYTRQINNSSDPKQQQKFEKAFKRRKPQENINQIYTYRQMPNKFQIQSKRRPKYTQTYEKDENRSIQIGSVYQSDQNQGQTIQLKSHKDYIFQHRKEKEIIQLLKKELQEEKNDAVILAKQLQKYKLQENKQKKQIFLLSRTIEQLQRQVEYLEDQLAKLHIQNLSIVKIINKIQMSNSIQQMHRKKDKPILFQRKIKQKQSVKNQLLFKLNANQLIDNQENQISKKLNLLAYRKQGAKDFQNFKQSSLKESLQNSLQEETLRKSQKSYKNQSYSKKEYKRINLNDLNSNEFNHKDKILKIRNKEINKNELNSERNTKQIQQNQKKKLAKQHRQQIKKLKADLQSFHHKRGNEKFIKI